jgi:HEAT repeat protein
LIGSETKDAPPAALIAALRHDPSPEVRTQAATALGRFRTGIDDIIPPLFDALVEDVVPVRSACNTALVTPRLCPSPKLVPYLIKSLREGRDLREGCRAASLLGRLGPAAREAVPALIDSLKEPPGHRPVSLTVTPSRSLAVRSSGDLRSQESPSDWDPACESALALVLITKGTGSSSAAITALTEALKSKHLWRRGAAARGLMIFESEAAIAVPALAVALTEAIGGQEQSGNEMFIAIALGRTAPGSASAREAVKALTAALNAKEEGTRMWAAHALGKFGTDAASAVPRLRTLLQDSNSSVSGTATEALRVIDTGTD